MIYYLPKEAMLMSVKSDNFKRISDNRVKKINDLISKLHNLINPSFYEYDDEGNHLKNRPGRIHVGAEPACYER